MEEHEDQKYIRALCVDDFVLIQEIYEKCSPQCRNYISKNNGGIDDARDVFQEALIDVHQKCRDLTLAVPICKYLYAIYRNKWLNKLRRRNNLLRILKDVGYISSNTSSTEITSLDEKMDQILMECFSKLGKSCQDILNMMYKEGMKGQQIAEKLNIKPNAVYQRMSDCRKKLRTCFEQHPDYKKLKH